MQKPCPEYFLFTEKLHKFLVKDGYDVITNIGHTSQNKGFLSTQKAPKGYILTSSQLYFGANTKPADIIGLDIWEVFEAFVPNQENGSESHIVCQAQAPKKIKITDSVVQYSIRSERIKEMYDANTDEPFYLVVDKSISKPLCLLSKKLNKCGFRRDHKNSSLIKKIKTRSLSK